MSLIRKSGIYVGVRGTYGIDMPRGAAAGRAHHEPTVGGTGAADEAEHVVRKLGGNVVEGSKRLVGCYEFCVENIQRHLVMLT